VALRVIPTCVVLLGTAACVEALANQSLTTADYPLGGDTSCFDYQSFDPTTNRLFIAHLGAGAVVVFDTQSHNVIGTMGGLPGVHGVISVPETGTVYANRICRVGEQRSAAGHGHGFEVVYQLVHSWPRARRPVVRAAAGDAVCRRGRRLLSAFRTDPVTRGRLELVGQSVAGPNAHSVAVDTNTGHIYVPTIDSLGVAVLREMAIGSPGATDY
jgi:hypothetical protein